MDTDNKKPEEARQETGNAYLIGGACLGAYGVTVATATGLVCPMCLIGTPLLLGYGGWQKYKFMKEKKE